MHFRAARRRRRASRGFPPKRLIARECVAFYVGELRFEVVVDLDGPHDRMFFFLRRLPAQNVSVSGSVRAGGRRGAILVSQGHLRPNRDAGAVYEFTLALHVDRRRPRAREGREPRPLALGATVLAATNSPVPNTPRIVCPWNTNGI